MFIRYWARPPFSTRPREWNLNKIGEVKLGGIDGGLLSHFEVHEADTQIDTEVFEGERRPKGHGVDAGVVEVVFVLLVWVEAVAWEAVTAAVVGVV